jgi:hypothetical protein
MLLSHPGGPAAVTEEGLAALAEAPAWEPGSELVELLEGIFTTYAEAEAAARRGDQDEAESLWMGAGDAIEHVNPALQRLSRSEGVANLCAGR